jgi:hypothetical protein
MVDLDTVRKYELTESQKEKIWEFMVENGFENVQASVDVILTREWNARHR